VEAQAAPDLTCWDGGNRAVGRKVALVVFIPVLDRQTFRTNLNELQQMDWISSLEVSLQPRKVYL